MQTLGGELYLFVEVNWLYNQRIQGYPIGQIINKNMISTIRVTRLLIVIKGIEGVIKEKLRYPANIKAILFAVSLLPFCILRKPTINPSKIMKLNTIIKFIILTTI